MIIKKFKFKQVISTNKTAIRILKKSNLNNGMIISDLQKKGKGQREKKWISNKGNLFLSFFFNIDKTKISIKRITKINCLLVKKLISRYYKKNIIIKYPNDLLIDKKKICGILQETVIKLDSKYLIVGIGINLKKNPLIKNYPTINLFDLIERNIRKKEIENKLKNIFELNLGKIYKKHKITN